MMKRDFVIHQESVVGLRNWISDSWEKQLPQVFPLEENKNLCVLGRVTVIDTYGPTSAVAQVMATIKTIENGASFQTEPFPVVVFTLSPYRGNSVKVVAECHQTVLLSAFSKILTELEPSQEQEVATHQLSGISFGPINSAGDVNINFSNVAGGNQTTTTTAETITQQTPSAAATHHTQRAQVLRDHIQLHQTLLRQYEERRAVEDDPRRLLDIDHNIEREKETLSRYGAELKTISSFNG